MDADSGTTYPVNLPKPSAHRKPEPTENIGRETPARRRDGDAPRPVPYVVQVRDALRGISVSVVPSLHRNVLLALAFYANPDGSECFPAVKTIAEDVGIARHRVSRVLRELETALWIQRVGRAIPGRGQTSTTYRVRLGGGPITVLARKRPGQRALVNKAIPLPEGVADIAVRRAARANVEKPATDK